MGSRHFYIYNKIVWILLLLLLLLLSCVTCYNIDVSIPVIKLGSAKSYFGFSIAQHQIDGKSPVLLVGAPRDNVTSPAHMKTLIRPGAVNSCPLTTLTNDCTQVEIDREKPAEGFDRNDQWLGVSVASQSPSSADAENRRAIACAHRFRRTGRGYQRGNGICFTMLNDLSEHEQFEPCDGKPSAKGHAQYGLCQAGISVALDTDGRALLGVPGPYVWRGAAAKYDMSSSLDADNQWYWTPVEEANVQEGIPNPVTKYDTYLGMSVKIGKIIKGQTTYVAGAPRSRDAGEVLMFTQTGTIKWLSVKQEHHLVGEQPFSGFGYDLAVLDINSDGLDDLVVSAPFFCNERTALAIEHTVGGAIYVYMNGKEGITSATRPVRILSREMKASECDKLACHNARFGFALAALGDIDGDGYQDLAVGAPFEGQGGAVYIYRGSASGIITDPSQRITPESLPAGRSPRPLMSFGYSLDGGVDMDDNSYPDLAVGAYLSDAVVVLRTRPVVTVTAVITSDPIQVNPKTVTCPFDGQRRVCVKLTICFRFRAEPKNRYTKTMDLDYSLTSDPFRRVSIQRGIGDGSSLNGTVKMNAQSDSNPTCIDHIVYLDATKDILNPILFQLTCLLKAVAPPNVTPGQPVPELYSYPVLNLTQIKYQHFVHFVKNCGQDEVCDSDLSLAANLQLPTEGSDYIVRLGEDAEVRINVAISNRGEDAHETSLLAMLPAMLVYRGTDSTDRAQSCSPLQTTSSVFCAIDSPMQKDETVTFTLRLDPSRLTTSMDNLVITLVVNTTSRDQNTNDNQRSFRLQVKANIDLGVQGSSDPYDVFYSGQYRDPSTIQYVEQIGAEIKHYFEVTNLGSAIVASSILLIDWPLSVNNPQNNDFLLYLMQPPEVDGGVCSYDVQKINPLNFKQTSMSVVGSLNTSEHLRVRRQAKTAELTEKQYTGDVTLGCSDSTTLPVNCVTFRCQLPAIHPGRGTVIKIYSRFWNNTFAKLFPESFGVAITSSAKVMIDPSLDMKQTREDNDITVVTTRALPLGRVARGIPLWIIILAACAGLLLLIIVIVLLWRCGFFRRSKPDDELRLQGNVKRQKSETEED